MESCSQPKELFKIRTKGKMKYYGRYIFIYFEYNRKEYYKIKKQNRKKKM